ncbi:MAG TPA: ATP-binding protein [Azospirillum sp.]|nr:ATP-binding protein [Azospirillum sp.]
MRWISRMPLSVKIRAAFLLVFTFTLAVSLFSISELHSVNAAADAVKTNWLPSTRVLGDINNHMSDLRTTDGNRLLAATPAEKAWVEREAASTLALVDASLQAYERLPINREEETLYEAFRREWRAYLDERRAMIDAFAAGETERAVTLYRESSRTLFFGASDRLTRLTDFNQTNGTVAADSVIDTFLHARMTILLALAVQCGLVAAALVFFTRHMTEPMLTLAGAMLALSEGRPASFPPYARRGDEVGTMARAVDIFRASQEALSESRSQLQAQAVLLEEKLARERELAMLQRNFVSMVSHEFRTPLTVIDGQAQRILKLRAQLTPDDLANRTGRIRDAVTRMTTLINGILQAAPMADGELPFDPEPADLARALAAVCEQQAEVSEQHRLSWDFSQLPGMVVVDANLLQQAVENLLSNAVKYSPPGSAVRVRGWSDAGQIHVAVDDRGIGIPESDRDRLFERYFRGRNVGTRAGSGLGLHVVQAIVARHGGRLDVDSREGEGSTFTMILPKRTPATTEAQA